MTRTLTGVLGVVVLALLGVLAAEAWYLWGVSASTPTAARPVVIGDIDAQTAVSTAAQDAARIFTTSWRGYDAHLSEVTPSMTDRFAHIYRAGAAAVRHRVVASRSRMTTRVAASGVVRASPGQVVALVFLDQRTVADGGRPSYDERPALVTMVHTDRGWLVDNVQTQ
jgi:Mce-associated membrane protein